MAASAALQNPGMCLGGPQTFGNCLVHHTFLYQFKSAKKKRIPLRKPVSFHQCSVVSKVIICLKQGFHSENEICCP